MRNNLLKSFCFLLILFVSVNVRAQKTWANVYTILHTNCSSSSCHGRGSSNNSFNVDTSAAVLFTEIINGPPLNPYAKNIANNKLVVPSSPQTSFMMRKLAHCTGNALKLKAPDEGAAMPNNAPALADSNLELILRWIWQGASETAAISPDTVAGSICDLPLSVRMLQPQEVSFTLSPNPVMNDFSLSYELKNSSLVSIVLLSADGRIVKPLIDESQNAGRHDLTFAATLSPGVYFLRLMAGSGQSFLKFVKV